MKGSDNPACAVVALEAAQRVAAVLGEYRFRWCDERDLQSAVGEVLGERFDVQAEFALSRRDRPDFVATVHGRIIAVEVKVRGSRTEIMRQLGRYAAHSGVDAVVLASGRRALLPGLPERIHGTPVVAVFMNGALQ